MKKFLAFMLALIMVCSMVGCRTAEVTKDIISRMPEEQVHSAYPVTVTDQAGREVTIEEQPERVVSGYYISTSALIALGQKDSLVGIEAKADKRPIYSLSAPELIGLPNVGTAKEFDMEGCLALEPDVVFLPMKLKEAAATLEELEIDVILVNPENQALFTEMVQIMGSCLNCPEETAALTAFSEKVYTVLEEALVNSEAPTVYLAGNSDFLSTAPNGMYQSDLIMLAGGTNAAEEIQDTYWVDVSYEQVLDWNPDYIILASDASYTVDDVLADPALAECEAVVNGNVYQMPNKAEAWDSPVPGGALGAAWMANILHADLVAEETVQEMVNEFYETFYGFEYPA